MSRPHAERPEDRQILAGEYVLGALEAAEMHSVRLRANDDASLADAILAWERRLAPLADAVAPVSPPPELWARIEAATTAPDVPRVPPAPAQRPMPSRRVWPWQAATAASLALAAGLAAFTVLAPPAPSGPRVAVLLPADAAAAGSLPDPTLMMQRSTFSDRAASAGFLAEARPDGALVLTALGPVSVPAGRDLQLWIRPKGAKAPASLGLLPAAGRQVKLREPPAAGAQLIISLEPRGGSPTGAPTGPVLYAGSFRPPSP
jgi:anti-sigma-K factor RskA